MAGAVGLAVAPGGRPKVAWDFSIEQGRIVGIDMFADPETLLAARSHALRRLRSRKYSRPEATRPFSTSAMEAVGLEQAVLLGSSEGAHQAGPLTSPPPRGVTATVRNQPEPRRVEDRVENLETILYEERGAVAIVTLNRPEVHNAFNLQMQHELKRVWRSLRTNDGVRAVVLTGAGEKAFCTGIDRKEAVGGYLERPADETWGAERSGRVATPFMFNDPGSNINPKENDLWKPVIAAVNGMACGGAFYMLGESDITIAAEHATFFDPHVTYGMVAGFETVHMLQKLPLGETLRIALLGATERMSAERGINSDWCQRSWLRESSSTVRSGSLRRSPRRRRSRFKERSAPRGWPRRPCAAKR